MVPNEKLRAVIAIQTRIAQLGANLGEVMQLVAEQTLSLLGADGAVIELAEGEDMVYRAAAGSAARSLGVHVSRNHSLSGLCVDKGEVLLCTDSETDPRVDRDACRRVGLRSMVVLPLLHDGLAIGVLKAMSGRTSYFGEDDALLLGLLGDAVSTAMFHATRQADADLFHRATHDPLTDLPNRALFADRLNAALAGAQRQGLAVGALMVDVDDLKPINDQFGHACGDAVLVEVAGRLGRCARGSDTVARIGGDEFAVVLSPLEAEGGIAAAIARLQDSLAPPFRFRDHDITIRASIGGAVALAEADNPFGLLELADQRMYAAKRLRKQQAPR